MEVGQIELHIELRIWGGGGRGSFVDWAGEGGSVVVRAASVLLTDSPSDHTWVPLESSH